MQWVLLCCKQCTELGFQNKLCMWLVHAGVFEYNMSLQFLASSFLSKNKCWLDKSDFCSLQAIFAFLPQNPPIFLCFITNSIHITGQRCKALGRTAYKLRRAVSSLGSLLLRAYFTCKGWMCQSLRQKIATVFSTTYCFPVQHLFCDWKF